MPRIPDRWFDYSFVGKQISDTPFVALKCPLQDSFFHNTPLDMRFGPNQVKTLLPSLSMIIDLTFSYSYYDKNVFLNLGIKHKKILCEGHKIPHIDLLKRFFFIVDEFLQSKRLNGDVGFIGVHCTHGVNRTGFFVCSYMISKLGYTFENAVKEFNQARGHDIERQNYLQELRLYEKTPLSFIYDPNYVDRDENPINDEKIKKRIKPRSRNGKKSNRPSSVPSESDTNTVSHDRRAMYYGFHSGRYQHNFNPVAVGTYARPTRRNLRYANYNSRYNYRNVRNNTYNPVPPLRNFDLARRRFSRFHGPPELL